MSRLYHLTSWHGDKKSEQCHVKQNCNLYRCITKLYERVFDKKYKTADCRQLNFHCGNYSEMKLLGCFDGFCQVLVPYNIQEFLEYPDNKKK